MAWHSAYSRWSARSKKRDALFVDAMVSGLCRLVEYQVFKLFNLAVPAQIQRIQAGLGANPAQKGGLVSQSQCVVDKGFVLRQLCFQTIFFVAKVFSGRRVVKGDHSEPTGHGFENHVAKGVGFAWKQEQVARRIMPGQIFSALGAAENVFRVAFRQLFAHWAVSHKNEANIGMEAPDPFKTGDRHAQVLLGGQSAHVKYRPVTVGQPPAGAQVMVTLVGSEAMAVHAAAPQAGRVDAHGLCNRLHFACWYQSDGGPVVEPAAIGAE